MITISGGTYHPLHPDSNYMIAGALCNAFVIGELGSSDDFFLIGTPPHDGTDYPLLTGNILDSEGNVLFRLVQNTLVVNPRDCAKIIGDHIGYKIQDGQGATVLEVRTTYELVERVNREMYVTRIAGNFHNKKKSLVFWTTGNQDDGLMTATEKFALGITGTSMGVRHLLTDEEKMIAIHAVASKGKIHEPLRGLIAKQKLSLDGKLLINAELRDCEVSLNSGDFAAIGENSLHNCKITIGGNVERAMVLLGKIPFNPGNQSSNPPQPSAD